MDGYRNVGKFVEECNNLLNHVGKGYVEGDRFNESRYDSEIPGVEYIRLVDWTDKAAAIWVYVYSPKGYLLPSVITLNGIEYNIEFRMSSHYSGEIDY